jgi:hypothetical protein
MRQLGWIGCLILALAGCGKERQAAPPKGAADARPGTSDPFAALVLGTKPDKLLTVRQALAAKEGDIVAVTGRTPPEKVKPFNPGVAAFVLMDPADLEKENIQEEFDCDDAAT